MDLQYRAVVGVLIAVLHVLAGGKHFFFLLPEGGRGGGNGKEKGGRDTPPIG